MMIEFEVMYGEGNNRYSEFVEGTAGNWDGAINDPFCKVRIINSIGGFSLLADLNRMN